MDTSDMKKGLKFMYDGQPWVCVEFQFVKPGKGQAFTRTKMRHLLTGSTVEKNIRSGEKISPADAEELNLQYIFPEADAFVFMNERSGEQVSVNKEICGDAKDFLIDGVECQITFYQGNAVALTLPPHIVVQVVSTEPGFKGDTATNVLKPAKIVTGATIQVPLFVSEGEWVKVDTRTHEYTERVRNPQG
ncbi:MAG TPA: elongation factor P [Polyangiaceae bacterium]|nr:elongation factor P [Polyangiaceae bacterium]